MNRNTHFSHSDQQNGTDMGQLASCLSTPSFNSTVIWFVKLGQRKKKSSQTGTLAICVMIANFVLNHNFITAVSYF